MQHVPGPLPPSPLSMHVLLGCAAGSERCAHPSCRVGLQSAPPPRQPAPPLPFPTAPVPAASSQMPCPTMAAAQVAAAMLPAGRVAAQHCGLLTPGTTAPRCRPCCANCTKARSAWRVMAPCCACWAAWSTAWQQASRCCSASPRQPRLPAPPARGEPRGRFAQELSGCSRPVMAQPQQSAARAPSASPVPWPGLQPAPWLPLLWRRRRRAQPRPAPRAPLARCGWCRRMELRGTAWQR